MLELKRNEKGITLPIVTKGVEKVCKPEDIVFFFRNCFAPKERKFKMILLMQLGCACRIREACAINLKDFHKDSSFRKLSMLIQKKAWTINGKVLGKNLIVTKIIPESIAAHIRSWILDNWEWINENQGYIFPGSSRHKTSYLDPLVIQRWFCGKRKQLVSLFPGRGFDKTIGMRKYKKQQLGVHYETTEYYHLWSSHMMKRFAGTYTYLMTKDPVFVQHLLAHDKIETTNKFYIDPLRVADNRKQELIKNKLFDEDFYKAITGENDKVTAVWEVLRKKK